MSGRRRTPMAVWSGLSERTADSAPDEVADAGRPLDKRMDWELATRGQQCVHPHLGWSRTSSAALRFGGEAIVVPWGRTGVPAGEGVLGGPQVRGRPAEFSGEFAYLTAQFSPLPTTGDGRFGSRGGHQATPGQGVSSAVMLPPDQRRHGGSRRLFPKSLGDRSG